MESNETPTCPDCGKPGEWVSQEEIYGRIYNERAMMVYLCREHDTYVGCHGNTRRPLGTMAGPKLRALRGRVHGLIDPYWRDGIMKRYHVYYRLSRHFGFEFHVGAADEDLCNDTILIADQILSMSTEAFFEVYPKEEPADE